jgi:hypothetical protein
MKKPGLESTGSLDSKDEEEFEYTALYFPVADESDNNVIGS